MSSVSAEELNKTRNKMLIAARIDETLKELFISQKEFAQIMGKTESEISDWLSGTRNFTVDTISEIETKLGIKFLNNFFSVYKNSSVFKCYYRHDSMDQYGRSFFATKVLDIA